MIDTFEFEKKKVEGNKNDVAKGNIQTQGLPNEKPKVEGPVLLESCGSHIHHYRSEYRGFEPYSTTLNAIREGDLRTVQHFVISGGVDVNGRTVGANARTSCGLTLLQLAVRNGRIEIAEFLIEKGADVNAQAANHSGTALHAAAESGNTEIAELLIEHRADVNAKGQRGGAPLHTAVWGGCIKTVKLLIEHGADVNAKTDRSMNSMTPLDVAVTRRHIKIVELLKAAMEKSKKE